MAAIRTTQQFIQYAADPASESDVRVTRLFAQVAVTASGATVRNASNSLGWVGTVQQQGNIVVNADDILGWTAGEDAEFDPVHNEFVSQQIFGQTVEALYREASNTYFVDVASPDAYREVVQFFGWTDREFFGIGNGFRFKSVATIAVIADVSNFWFTNPTQNNKVVQGHVAANALGWIDVLAATADVQATNAFGFVELIASVGLAGRDVVQDGGGFLRQTVSVKIDNNDCRELEYAPVIGSTDDEEFDEFRISPPIFSTGTVEFSFPVESPTDTLTLDDPDFGNGDTLNFTRIDRETRGGDRKIFSDQRWGTWERLDFNVTGLQKTDADEIIAFLNTTLGKKIRLTDWEGRQWEGYLDSLRTDIVHEQRGWRFSGVYEGKQTTAVAEHNEAIVTHNVNPGDDVVVVHDT